jgi:hypothetical protein
MDQRSIKRRKELYLTTIPTANDLHSIKLPKPNVMYSIGSLWLTQAKTDNGFNIILELLQAGGELAALQEGGRTGQGSKRGQW